MYSGKRCLGCWGQQRAGEGILGKFEGKRRKGSGNAEGGGGKGRYETRKMGTAKGGEVLL